MHPEHEIWKERNIRQQTFCNIMHSTDYRIYDFTFQCLFNKADKHIYIEFMISFSAYLTH